MRFGQQISFLEDRRKGKEGTPPIARPEIKPGQETIEITCMTTGLPALGRQQIS